MPHLDGSGKDHWSVFLKAQLSSIKQLGRAIKTTFQRMAQALVPNTPPWSRCSGAVIALTCEGDKLEEIKVKDTERQSEQIKKDRVEEWSSSALLAFSLPCCWFLPAYQNTSGYPGTFQASSSLLNSATASCWVAPPPTPPPPAPPALPPGDSHYGTWTAETALRTEELSRSQFSDVLLQLLLLLLF